MPNRTVRDPSTGALVEVDVLAGTRRDTQDALTLTDTEVSGVRSLVSGDWSGATGAYHFLRNLKAGQPATLLVCSDSTGAGTDRWVYKIATALASLYPTSAVSYHAWADGASAYSSAVSVSAGSGGPAITVRNAGVAGKQVYYQHGSNFEAAYGSSVGTADWIIINHGHNHDFNWNPEIHAEYLIAAGQSIVARHPRAGVSIVAQNPRQDNTQGTNRSWGAKVAAQIMGWDLIDVWSMYEQAGKPLSWYDPADPVHPSVASGGGDDIIFSRLIYPRLTQTGAPLTHVQPSINSRVQNLLANGNFASWTSTDPDSWIAVNATSTKETSIYETAGWSLRITHSASGPKFSQTLSGDTVRALRGRYVTVAARLYIPAATTDAVSGPDLEVSSDSGSTYSSSVRGPGITSTNGRDGWVWTATRLLVPSTATHLRVSTPGPGLAGGRSIYVDRVCLTTGMLPADMA